MRKDNIPEKKPVPDKAKRWFRRYAAAVMTGTTVVSMAIPAFAEDIAESFEAG